MYSFSTYDLNSVGEVSVVPIYNVNGVEKESQMINSLEKVPESNLSEVDRKFIGFGYHEYEGLVAYYPFTNDGKDYSGNGNNGSLEGNAYVNNNGELVLDGDDYVKVFDKGDFVFGVSDSYTSVYWVKANFEEQLTSYTRVLMEASAFYTYRHPGSSDISLSAWNSSSATGNHFVLQEVFDGDWHQIVLVMDRENQKAKAYKDGEQIGGAQSVEVDWFPTSYSNSPNNHMYIGIHSSISYGLKGSIDNVMVFNRALTSEEINEIYEIQKKE